MRWINFIQFLENIFGVMNPLQFSHMCARGALIYVLGLLLIRINKRFMGMRTVFNYILSVIIGSIFAGATIGATPFFPTLGTIILIMLLNALFSALVFHSKTIEYLLKGEPAVLVKNGEIQWNTMRRHFITRDELMDAVRTRGQTKLKNVKWALFENTGHISVITKDNEENDEVEK